MKKATAKRVIKGHGMSGYGWASCRAFRWHPCRRPRTFWHCPKGSWTSQRLASLWAVREACVGIVGGFRWAPATFQGAPSEIVEFNPRQGDLTEAAKNGSHHFAFNERRRPDWTPDTCAQGQNRWLIVTRSAWFAERYRVWDETRMNDLFQYGSPQQDSRAGDLGAARVMGMGFEPAIICERPSGPPG
jgi:hypothetical protein